MDELAVMDGSECILQLRGVRPFLSKKYDVTKHPLYSQLADADRRNAFNIKEHLTTRLGLRAEDEFAVYEFRPLVPPEQRVTDSIISATKK